MDIFSSLNNSYISEGKFKVGTFKKNSYIFFAYFLRVSKNRTII